MASHKILFMEERVKNTSIQFKVSQSFKDRVRKWADFLGIGISAFIVQAITEKIERLEEKEGGQ